MGGLGTAKWGTSRKPKEKTDAQSHAQPCDRVAVRRIGGADAQTSSGARCCAELHADRTGGVPGMGTLLSAWICPRVRPVPMLVSSLLVTDMRTARPPWRPRHRTDGGEYDLTRHDRAWVTRRARHGRRIQRAFTA